MRWVRWPNLVQYGGIAIIFAAAALLMIPSGNGGAAAVLSLLAALFGWFAYRFWRWRLPVRAAH
jgi:hypothetical protein